MKRFISYILSIALLSSSFSAFAKAPDNSYTPIPKNMSLVPTGSFLFAADLPPIAGHEGAQIFMAEVEPGNELNAAFAMANNPEINSRTTFITEETGDKVKDHLDPKKSAIVSSDNPARDIQQAFRPYLPYSAMPGETKGEYRTRFGKALIFAIIPATGVTGAYYFVSSKYMLMADFTFGYTVAALFGIYIHKWFKLAHGSGHFINFMALAVAKKVFGTHLSEAAQGRWFRFGEILAAYGLNVFSQTGVGLVGGTLRDIGTMGHAFMNALTATDEAVDSKLLKLFSQETVVKILSPLRMVLFSFLSMLAMAGVEPVRIGLEYTLVGIALTHIFEDLIDPAAASAWTKAKGAGARVWRAAKGVFGFTKNAIKLKFQKSAARCEGELTEPIRIEARNRDAA
jgi:hypothetical protein